MDQVIETSRADNPDGAEPRPAPSCERQRWVRFVMPHVVTKLSWQASGVPCVHLVSLVNVSAQGALVLADVEPPQGEPVWISIDRDGQSTGPIRSALVGKETTEYGKT